MKKLFSIIIAMICGITLSSAAFSAETDAYSVYKKYVKKSKSISSMELTITQKLSMVADGQTVELTKQNATAKMIITKDNKLQMEMKLTDSASKETVNAYFKDNYLYQKIGDEKFKIKMDMNDALAETANMDLGLTEDMLKDAKVEKVDAGTKITYKTKLSDKDSVLAPILKELNLPNNIKMTVTSMTTSLTISDDGVLKSNTNTFSINLNDGKENFKLKVSQTTKVKSIDTVTKINYPADLNSYKAV